MKDNTCLPYPHNAHSLSGFTLVEILVVIAIISILSAIAMVSLSKARLKGVDAAIKSEAIEASSQADLYQEAHGSFHSVCSASDGVKNLLDVAITIGSGDTQCLSSIDDQGYALAVQLKSDPSKYFCVDYTGRRMIRTGRLWTHDCTVPWPQ